MFSRLIGLLCRVRIREANMVEKTQVDYQESGDGPVVVFVPGSFSTPAAWRPVMKLLPPGYRMVATALCG